MTDADTTVPVDVIRACGTMEIEAAVRRGRVAAGAGTCMLIAGIAYVGYRPGAPRQHWQFHLSHWGQPPVVVSSHRLRRDAEAQMERLLLLNRARDLHGDATCAALVRTLAVFSDGEVE